MEASKAGESRQKRRLGREGSRVIFERPLRPVWVMPDRGHATLQQLTSRLIDVLVAMLLLRAILKRARSPRGWSGGS